MKPLTQELIALTLVWVSLGHAHAGIINGSFETGDLTGWTPNSPTLVTVATDYQSYGPLFTPVDGSYFALLFAGLGNVYTTLSQTFVVNAGDILTGSAFFQANDHLPLDDDAYVRIVQNGHILFQSSVSDVGNFGNTPWTSFTYVFPSGGTYTLEAGVRNIGDAAFSSVIGLDDVRLFSQAEVPEPSHLALFVLLTVPLGMLIGRRCRQPTTA